MAPDGHSDYRPAALEQRLLNDYQRDFPLAPAPFATIAAELGVTEIEVLESYERLLQDGLISRVGAVLRPHRCGWSTLAAMAVPADRLEAVAEMVSAYPEVNHNYEREHRLNLWFVVTAPDHDAVSAVLADIEGRSGLEVLDLPLEEAFCLDLGFALSW